MSTMTRLVASILVFLALFQATEYAICGGSLSGGNLAARIGFASITMLPPLGLHLAHAIANKKPGKLVWAAYGTGASFVGFFLLTSASIPAHACYDNYAVFSTLGNSGDVFGLFYYGWMAVAIGLALQWAASLPLHRKRALYALVVGYAAFIIPTATVNILDPSTLAGIPSIMCGFAVLLAFMLVLKVSPEVLQPHGSTRTLHSKLRS